MSQHKAIDEMHDETCLERRGAVYYFRMKVPADLRETLKPKAEVRHSLRTRDKAEAKRRLPERKATQLREWAQLRDRLMNGPRLSITADEIRSIVSQATARLLAFDEDERMRGRPLNRDIPAEGGNIGLGEVVDERDRMAIAEGKYPMSLRMAAEDWLTYCGFELSPESDDYLQFIYAFAQGSREATKLLRLRAQGEVVPTPPEIPIPQSSVPSLPASAPSGQHMLHELLPIWKRLRSPAPSTVEIYEFAAKRFQERHPGLTVEGITKGHIRRYVEYLQSEGMSASTIDKNHGAVRALLSFAEHEDWITSNPAKGVMLPARESAKMRSYTPQELEQLFRSPVFTEGMRPVAGKGEAAYWIPLLLLFTGARREEICQLALENVRETEGIPYLAIDPREDSGRLKTDESRRAVPVHPMLLRLGFMRYVEELRKAGETLLFPRLDKPNKRGQVGAKWGDWWARYVRGKVGITDTLIQPSHGFRHLFVTECRRIKIDGDQARTLVGHKGSDTHDNYGEHLVSALAAEVARMDFRGLSLKHLVPE